MAEPVGTLAVRIAADASQFKAELAKVSKGFKSFGKHAEVIGKAFAGAMAGLAGSLTFATRAASEQLGAEKQLANAFAATGKAIDLDSYRALASSLQDVTTVGDETTIAMGSVLARFGTNQKQLEALTPAVLDMASAMNVDLSTAAQAVGKAFSGQVGSLSRYGVVLSESEKAMIASGDASTRTATLVKALESRFKGAATAATQTASGAFKQFQNALSDTQENLGMVLDKPLAEFFRSVASAIKELPVPLQMVVAGFAGLGQAGGALLNNLGALLVFGPKLGASFAALGTVIKASVLPSLLPIAAILAAIAAAIAGVVLAVGALKQAWDGNLFGLRDTVRDVAQWISDAWHKTVTFFKDAWAAAVEWVMSAWAKVKTMVSGIEVARPAFAAAASMLPELPSLDTYKTAISDFIEDAKGGVNAIKSSWATGVGVFKDLFGSVRDMIGWTDDASVAQKETAQASHTLATGLGSVTKAASEVDWSLSRHMNKSGTAVLSSSSTTLDADPGSDSPMSQFKARVDESAKRWAKQFGSSVDNAVVQMTAEISTAVSDFGNTFGTEMLNASGSLGEVASAAVQGFQTAGPWGAIAGVMADLISRSESFKESSAAAEGAIGDLVDAFEPLAEAMQPMTAVTHEFISIFAGILKPIFEKIGPIFKWLAEALRYLGLGVLYIIKGIGMLWNGILGAIQSVFRKLADISIFGRHPLGFLDDWARGIQRAEVSMGDLDGTINDLQNATIPQLEEQSDAAGDALGGAADAANETAQVLNAPQGFKVEAARFNATIAEPRSTTGLSTAGAGAGVMAQQPQRVVNIENVQVVTNNPEEFMREVERVSERNATRLTGSPISGSTSPVRQVAR